MKKDYQKPAADSAKHDAWLSGKRPEKATAIILVGGKSERMGRDKAALDIHGVPAAQRLCSLLQPEFDEVIFSTAPGKPCLMEGVRCVHDSAEGLGPLAGIAAGLSGSTSRANFIMACDIPELDISLMRTLLSHLDEYEIAVPAFPGKPPEPLFGAYARLVGETAQRLVTESRLKVSTLFTLHPTCVVDTADMGWYANLNTPQDYHRFIHKNMQVD